MSGSFPTQDHVLFHVHVVTACKHFQQLHVMNVCANVMCARYLDLRESVEFGGIIFVPLFCCHGHMLRFISSFGRWRRQYFTTSMKALYAVFQNLIFFSKICLQFHNENHDHIQYTAKIMQVTSVHNKCCNKCSHLLRQLPTTSR